MKESALKKNDLMHGPLTLVVINRLDALREMSAWLETALRHLGMQEDLIFNFDVCANEAVTNIISYAYPEHGMHKITLRLSMQEQALALEIKDDGMPFNPLARPPHVQPANLEEAAIGGLGIDLIRSFMDECHYARVHQHNILKMIAHVRDQTGANA